MRAQRAFEIGPRMNPQTGSKKEPFCSSAWLGAAWVARGANLNCAANGGPINQSWEAAGFLLAGLQVAGWQAGWLLEARLEYGGFILQSRWLCKETEDGRWILKDRQKVQHTRCLDGVGGFCLEMIQCCLEIVNDVEKLFYYVEKLCYYVQKWLNYTHKWFNYV